MPPKIKGERFDMNNECRVLNYEQALKYMKNGAYPLRCEISNEGDRIVFIFDKVETKDLFHKFRRYEL